MFLLSDISQKYQNNELKPERKICVLVLKPHSECQNRLSWFFKQLIKLTVQGI